MRDSFEDRSRFHDLSTLVTWGGRPLGTSAFATRNQMGRNALALDREVLRYSDVNDDHSIRTFSAIDYRFPKVVAHRNSRLRIEFDVAWEKTTSGGESGRFTVVVLHEYPSGASRPSDVTRKGAAPFGRPAYTLRLLNGPRGTGTGEPFLQYGGGAEPRGTFDFSNGSWLPGFLLAPGGGQPGLGEPWPKSGWVEAKDAVGSTTWRRFAFVIEPHRMWLESIEDGVVVEQPLPESAPAPNYQYFEKLEGLRIAWRGLEQAYLANLIVTVQSL